MVPRNETTIFIECNAPEELFVDEWEDLDADGKLFFENNHLPCDGTGDMGQHCLDCGLFAEITYD